MELITTPGAARLTGLSTEQLREWTSRRALIPPDVKPKGHGSPARYSWQTILVLRIAVILRDRFKLELQAHRDLFSDLGSGFRAVSFSSLWGKSLVLHGGHAWSLLTPEEVVNATSDLIVLRLDPHLEALSTEFSLAQPLPAEQFQLFPALRLVNGPRPTGEPGRYERDGQGLTAAVRRLG
jgi:DNA-binding transcriptional MerR regulator